MPENESDPPQFNPSTIFDAEIGVRRSSAASSIICLISARAASTVLRVPPEPCSVIPFNRPDRGAFGPR